ncbi:hypothetical protein DFH11DRAFT_1739466 [Phellopilus nigrolimitatus]|nr:hypothetical protein DFH11DRAFT_1739466 [Phellopilus nigrolimitatus]
MSSPPPSLVLAATLPYVRRPTAHSTGKKKKAGLEARERKAIALAAYQQQQLQMQRQAVSSVLASDALAHGFTNLNSAPSQLALLLSSTLADADARELTVAQSRATRAECLLAPVQGLPSRASPDPNVDGEKTNGEREREKDVKAESKVPESAVKAVLDAEARAEHAERAHADLAASLQSLCAQFTEVDRHTSRATTSSTSLRYSRALPAPHASGASSALYPAPGHGHEQGSGHLRRSSQQSASSHSLPLPPLPSATGLSMSGAGVVPSKCSYRSRSGHGPEELLSGDLRSPCLNIYARMPPARLCSYPHDPSSFCAPNRSLPAAPLPYTYSRTYDPTQPPGPHTLRVPRLPAKFDARSRPHLLRSESLCLVGHPSDGSTVHDGELDRLDKEREKEANKRRKRTTPGQRGIALPNREPLKTHRTLAIGFPEVDPSTIALAAAAAAPTSRRAAAAATSVIIMNTVASEKRTAIIPTVSSTPSAPAVPLSKAKGSFKVPKYTQSNLKVRANVTAATPSMVVDSSTFEPPLEGDLPLRVSSTSASAQDSKASRIVSARRRRELEKEAKEREYANGQRANVIDGIWHCSNCGCPDSLAVGRRKGPLGNRSQCGACGKFWHCHRRPRSVEYSTDAEFYISLRMDGRAKASAKKARCRRGAPRAKHPTGPSADALVHDGRPIVADGAEARSVGRDQVTEENASLANVGHEK